MSVEIDDKSEPEYKVILADTRRLELIEQLVIGGANKRESIAALFSHLVESPTLTKSTQG